VLRKAIKQVKGNLRRIAFAHIDAIVRLAGEIPVSGRIDLPDGIRVTCDQQSLIISKHEQPMLLSDHGVSNMDPMSYEYTLDIPGAVYIKEADVQIKLTEMNIEAVTDLSGAGQQIAFFDINKLEFPLVVRNFRPGDRFTPLGMTGTQKLKKFFSNNKIPRAERARCPLLISCGKIIWVAGHRVDNSVRVDTETRKVLKAELLLA
jgi:tRNA(Ile)-lysidine synthase